MRRLSLFRPLGRIRAYFAVVVMASGVFLAAPFFPAAAVEEKVVEAETPPFAVDQNGTASTVVVVRNTTNTDLKGILLLRDFVSEITNDPQKAVATFSGQKGGQPGQSFPTDIKAGGSQYVKLDVSNIWQGGYSKAELLYEGRPVAILRALKYQVPFTVTVQTQGADTPLTFMEGEEGAVTLKNDDAMAYSLVWELTIRGKTVARSVPVYVPPKGNATVNFVTEREWFSAWQSLFKDDIQEARLTLKCLPSRSAKSDEALQIKSIPVKVRLLYWPPLHQQVLRAITIFVILLLGGLCSLLLSYWVPNRLKKHQLEEQFGALLLKIRALSEKRMDSSLRVMVRVQHNRLLSLLSSRNTLSPDFATVASDCAKGIAVVTRQVALLEEVDARYLRLEEAAKRGASPTALDQLDKALAGACRALSDLEPQDEDFLAAQVHVNFFDKNFDALGQPNPLFAVELVDRMTQLVKDLHAQTGRLGTVSKTEELRVLLPHLFNGLETTLNPAQASIAEYVKLDTLTRQLGLVRDYVELSGSAQVPEQLQRRLIGHLHDGSWQGLRAAQQLVRQVREGVFADEIAKAITSKDEPPMITIDPGFPHSYEPVCFAVTFPKRALNHAAALCEFDYDWDLGHAGLHETGCTVSHYFPVGRREETFEVRVTFKDSDGHAVKDQQLAAVAITRKVNVQPYPRLKKHARVITEGVYLGVALFATLLLMLAGATDQIAKLDFIPALVALFVIGYTADQVKRLLVSRPSG